WPVTTPTFSRSFTVMSDISIDANFRLPDRRFATSSDLWVTDPSAFVKIRSSASICPSALQSLRNSAWLKSASRALSSLVVSLLSASKRKQCSEKEDEGHCNGVLHSGYLQCLWGALGGES